MTSKLERTRERFRADPSDARAFEALEEHHFLAGDWAELVGLYEQRLSGSDLEAQPRARAPLLFRLGQVLEERTTDLDRATGCYGRAIQADPQYRPPLQQLRRIHTAREQWEMALQIAEVESALRMGASEQASLWAETGSIWLDRLGDAEQAGAHFEHALEADPRHVGALAGAARVHEACGRPHEAAARWEQAIEGLRGAERGRALVALARLLADPLGQPDRATELYRRTLTEDPRNAEAIEAMAAHAAANRQWPLLADLHERRFELSPPERRVAIALEAGQLERDRLSNPGAARVWFSRAAELAPEDPKIHEALADLERECGDDDALLRHLERLIELGGDAPRVSVLLEAASLQTDAGRDERAIDPLRRALELAPDDALIVEALSDTLSRLGRNEELIDLLERRAALASADPEIQAGVLFELGTLHEERLADPEAARHAFERAHRAWSAAPGVRDALERTYRKQEDWGALREMLEAASRAGPESERARVLCALGRLLNERFRDDPGAARAYEEALRVDSRSLAAHRGLQDIAASSGDDGAVIRAYEREAQVTSDRTRLTFLVGELVRLLEEAARGDAALAWSSRLALAAPEDTEALATCARLHGQLGHDEEFVAVLERLDPLLPSTERASGRRRLARHHDERGRVDEAIRWSRAALDLDPSHVETLERLVEALERAERWDELAPARRWLSELLPDEPRARCLDALARLQEEHLADLPGAIETLLLLADAEPAPANVEERIADLLERSERWDELAERLARRAVALPEGHPDEAPLALRRGRILLDELDRARAAATAFRAAREADPASAAALEGLEQALRRAGDPRALEIFLTELSESGDTSADRERAALERALLLEETLEDDDRARDTYRELVRHATDAEMRARAARRLEDLLERTGSWDALRRHLEGRPADEVEGGAAEHHVRVARLCRDRLADRVAAIAHLETATRLAPDRAELWRELAALYDAEGDALCHVGALEAELETDPDPERELALRARAASLRAGPLCDADAARAHFERVLELQPDHTAAAEYLIDDWERDGRFNAVVRLLEVRLDSLDNIPREADSEWKARRTSLRLRIAGICAGPLDDVDAAIAALEPGLGEIGYQGVVAEPLADLYQRAGYAEDFIDLCQRAASGCTDPAERANWFVRLGDALRGQDDRAAVEAYTRALSNRPDDRQTQAALRELYRRLGEAEPLARLLEADLARLAGAEEVPARLELVKLLAGPLERPAEGLLHLRRVLEIEPGHSQALAQALDLADRLRGANADPGELSELVLEVLDGALARMQSPAARAALLARRARLLASSPGHGEAAALAYRESLELEPNQPALRAELRALLEDQQRFDAVLECLLEEARGAPPEARAELFARGADVAEARFSADAALPWLERLGHEQPLDPSVAARVAAIQRTAGRHEAVLHALDLQIEKTAEASRRRDLRLEQATILEREFGSPTRAATALEAALEDSPSDTTLLHHLDRLYRAAGRPVERVRTLERLISSGRPEERLALQCEAASLYSGPLGDPRNAVRHLLRAVEATPRGSAVQTELLRALGESLRSAAPRDAWARCAERELRGLDPDAAVFDERRRELHRELAQTYECELGRPDDAMRHLWPLVDRPPPADDPMRVAEFESAERALLRLLCAEGNWLSLEGRLSSRLERSPEDAEGWLELARIRDERLRATAGAADAYREVLEREPDCLPALRGLRGAAQRLGDFSTVASTLERELERGDPEPPAERSALLRRLGDVCWHELQSTTRASRSYAGALEADPRDLESLHSLERLLETMEDWRSVLDLFESEIEILGEDETERKLEVWLRVGELARDHTGELERALRAYVHASLLGPLSPRHRFEMAELHERCGDLESFVEVFCGWCDDPDAGASSSDQLRLGDAFESLGRSEHALARAERAIELDPSNANAWEAAARRREARGDSAGAAEALSRVAELVPDGRAAERLLHAAELCLSDDAEGAAVLLRAAAQRDPASIPVQAALGRLAGVLDRASEAEQAARRALDLATEDDGRLPRAERLELALLGGRMAAELDRAESASRFYSEALSIEPDHAEAMAGYGSALAALDDNAGAARVLEARVEKGDSYPGRARHLVVLGRQRETEGEEEAAIERYREARDEDPSLDDAHANLARLLESADRTTEGIEALEHWADVAREPAERTERLLRAAAWELRVGGFEENAERHLREVLETDPGSAHTWQALATLLWDLGRVEEALDVATRALDGQEDEALLGPLALIQGRALEQRGDRRPAADAYRVTAEADPRCSEAALSGARLLRGLGEWRGAAELLQSFADRDPGEDPAALAEVLHQLARLRAGPLEDVDTAIVDYQRAVSLAPERRDVRAALAELLSHRPGAWKQALSHHRVLLDERPADPDTLRMLLRIARGRESESAMAHGLRLLGALGLLSPREREEAAEARELPLTETHELFDPLYEKLRLLANETSAEIAEALEASEPPGPPDSEDTLAAFRAASVVAEGSLTAPALLPLPTSEVGELLVLVASLCLDPDEVRAEGRLVNALSSVLGRRSRRRLRRLFDDTSLAAIQGVDFEAWRREVRALAAARAIDETGIDLREALLALLRDEARHPGEIADGMDLTPWVAECPQAAALLGLAVRTWLEDL